MKTLVFIAFICLSSSRNSVVLQKHLNELVDIVNQMRLYMCIYVNVRKQIQSAKYILVS